MEEEKEEEVVVVAVLVEEGETNIHDCEKELKMLQMYYLFL